MSTPSRLARTVLTAALVGGVLVAVPASGKPAAAAPEVTVSVASTRADLVTAGDALVDVTVPAGARGLRVDVGGRDVTRAFTRTSATTFTGLVTGLRTGTSTLRARLADGRGARLTVTNHPQGGPVFSGPQVQPWLCTTADNGLGAPTDAQCNAPSVFEFFYKNTAGDALQAYDPADPPSDVATVTTDTGAKVPFIVRRETGTANRGVHAIAVLYDPAEPFTATRPQAGWNRKVYYPFGASCNTNFGQGTVPGVLDERALAQGFLVTTSSLNILGQNCNTVTSAETVMMIKEHVTERYGRIRYTFGSGGSGGSIGQLAVSNAYPGLLQGLIPSATYPDIWTTSLEVVDCHLLLTYFQTISPHLWANEAQQTAVNGHMGVSSCAAWEALFVPVGNPSHGCGFLMQSTLPPGSVRTAQDYDPRLNRRGCRSTLQDLQLPIWGKRAEDGFAKSVWDNIGVQYGLTALKAGVITPEQFVDLNEKIGGVDIDLNRTQERMLADAGTPEIAHVTGQVNDGARLDQVAIIDLPSTLNVEIHTPFHAFQLEARLIREHGHGDNHAIWRGGDGDLAFDTMDDWLTAVERDRSARPVAAKIVANKPRSAVDSCFVEGKQVTDSKACDVAYPHFAEARVAAGAPVSSDTMKCTLKPLRRADYPAALTALQWERLQAAFPGGVCDWTRAGVGQVESKPWMSFTGGPGGRPLGAAPRSAALR